MHLCRWASLGEAAIGRANLPVSRLFTARLEPRPPSLKAPALQAECRRLTRLHECEIAARCIQRTYSTLLACPLASIAVSGIRTETR